MNAKLVVTVPIDSVPNKVSELLLDLSSKLENLSRQLEYSSHDIAKKSDLLYQIDTLDNVRQQLSLIDLNIEDCYGILKGYINYEYKIKNSEDNNAQQSLQEG